MLNMSEAQALIALPTFLAGPAETQFRKNLSGVSLHGGITCWPEAILYLLRTYATSYAMREDLEYLRNIRKGANEVEEEDRKRLNDAVFRWRNVQCNDEKMTLYVHRLSDTIRMVAARYLESVHRRDMKFENLTYFAKTDDEAYGAGVRHLTQSRGITSAPNPSSNALPRPQARFQTRKGKEEVNVVSDKTTVQVNEFQSTMIDEKADYSYSSRRRQEYSCWSGRHQTDEHHLPFVLLRE